MHVGVPLPPVPQLLQELSISRSTLDRVYATLQAEGLLQRLPRKGVFVADKIQTGDFAVVVPCWSLGADAATPYYQRTVASVVEQLHEQNPRWNARIHVGKLVQSSLEFPATLDLMEPQVLHRLRGVFSFHPLFEMEDALRASGVPTVGLMRHDSFRHWVFFDHESYSRAAVQHMVGRGCRKIGILARRESHRNLRSTARDANLQVRDSWCEDPSFRPSEPAGYEYLNRLLDQSDRPDGIIVAEDILSRGVVHAAMHRGVRLGGELKLFSFAVRGIELSYIQAVSRMEFDLHEQARLAMAMMQQLLRGQEPAEPRTLVPGEIIQGETT